MEIESLTIQDVGGISSLKLEKLNPHLNIICGENGIGKTNIIESVTACFTRYSQNKLKKKADSNRGLVKLSITNIDEEFKKIEYIVDSFYPRENNNHNNHLNLYQFWKITQNF